MADDTTSPTAETPSLHVRSKDFRVVYTNTFGIRASASDTAIAFGYVTLPRGQTIIQDEVEVVFTPTTLKLLKLALDDNIENLEKIIGPIKLPAELLEAIAAAKAEQQRVVTEPVKPEKK